MEKDQILIVFANSAKVSAKICIQNTSGYWIEFVRHDGNYSSEIHIHRRVPRDFINEMVFCYDDIQDLGFDQLDTLEFRFNEMLSEERDVDEKIDVFNDAVNMYRKLLRHGWQCESFDDGVAVLKTEFVYTTEEEIS
ncbi:hypothetical protein ACFL7D_04790 [candidate division KSB1 bacterium]